MSGQYLYSRSGREFEDSAFEPRSSFDFDDEGSHIEPNMPGFQDFSGDALNFNLGNGMYEGDEDFDHELFDNRAGPMDEPHLLAQNSRAANVNQTGGFRKDDFVTGPRPSVPQPQSAQSNIVNSRSNVKQLYGQITPPNDDLSEPFKTQPSKQQQVQQSRSQDPGKLTNEQRARNAANTRHSRSKNSKKKGEHQNSASDEEGTQKQGKNITLQREKNRVAAAKCRAKKKSANEQQEELASEYGSTNNFLTREIRELKNQKTELQNFLLAHRPGVCECHGIHDYNFGQAQRLVLNARRHVVEPMESPSRESALSTQSPGSEASAAGMFSSRSQISPPESMGMPSRQTSFSSAMNYGFPQGMHADAMQAGGNPPRPGHSMSQDFAEFLQSGPGGRAGFS